MTNKTKHTHKCENCNLELKAFCTTKHDYTLDCAKVEKLYFAHIKKNKDCLNKFYENLEKLNISLLKKGHKFQIRFTGKRRSIFRPSNNEINKLRKKHNIILDKELDGTINK